MAASGAKSGFGTTLTIGGTAITEILEITGPGQSRTMIEVTNMGSDDAAKEYIGGLLEGGEISLRISVLAAKMTTLYGLLDDTSPSSAVITLPTTLGTCTWTVNTWLSALTPRATVDDKVEADVTLKCTGKPVWAAS